jgi:hypothetical protein
MGKTILSIDVSYPPGHPQQQQQQQQQQRIVASSSTGSKGVSFRQ